MFQAQFKFQLETHYFFDDRRNPISRPQHQALAERGNSDGKISFH